MHSPLSRLSRQLILSTSVLCPVLSCAAAWLILYVMYLRNRPGNHAAWALPQWLSPPHTAQPSLPQRLTNMHSTRSAATHLFGLQTDKIQRLRIGMTAPPTAHLRNAERTHSKARASGLCPSPRASLSRAHRTEAASLLAHNSTGTLPGSPYCKLPTRGLASRIPTDLHPSKLWKADAP